MVSTTLLQFNRMFRSSVTKIEIYPITMLSVFLFSSMLCFNILGGPLVFLDIVLSILAGQRHFESAERR
jgi:hypothetical protein